MIILFKRPSSVPQKTEFSFFVLQFRLVRVSMKGCDDMDVVLLLDTSEFGRNEDYTPTRLVGLRSCAVLVAHVFDGKGHVCVGTAAKGNANFTEWTRDMDRIKEDIEGFVHFSALPMDPLGALRRAHLYCTRKQRGNSQGGKRRFVLFVASPLPLEHSVREWSDALGVETQLHLVLLDTSERNRELTTSLVSAIPSGFLEVSFLTPPMAAISLIQQPWIEKCGVTNAFTLFQRALGAAPPPLKLSEEARMAKEEQARIELEKKNKVHLVPSMIRAGQNFSAAGSGSTKLVVDFVSPDGTKKKITYDLNDEDDDYGGTGDISVQKDNWTLIVRAGKARLLMRLFTFTCGKCDVTHKEGDKRVVVTPKGKSGNLSLCLTNAGSMHWIWTDPGGAIMDDVILNGDFALDTVRDQARVVVLHNERARDAAVPSGARDDFFVDGRMRFYGDWFKGGFKCFYWLSSDQQSDLDVCETSNSLIQQPPRMKNSDEKLANFVQGVLDAQIAEQEEEMFQSFRKKL